MDVSQFVQETVLGILKGVTDAQQDEAQGKGVSPIFHFNMGHSKDHRGIFVHGDTNYTIVEFDLAVTTETGGGSNGGIKVLGFVTGDLSAEHTRGTASRIKFSVPIVLPIGKHALP